MADLAQSNQPDPNQPDPSNVPVPDPAVLHNPAQDEDPLKEVTISTQAGAAARAIGAENVRFDLSDLYNGINDPQIKADLKEVSRLYKVIDKNYRGQLTTKLGDALVSIEALERLESKLSTYAGLMSACSAQDQKIQRLVGQIGEKISSAAGEHLAFFDIEVGKIDDQTFASIVQNDRRVLKYLPWLEQIRALAKHNLSEEVERALTIRLPYGSGEWDELITELETKVTFPMTSDVFKGEDYYGKSISLEEIYMILEVHPSSETRAEALRICNEVLGKEFVPFMTRAMNVIAGEKNVEDAERHFPHIMSARNLDNRVSDDVVKALHDSVSDTGAALCKRYYRLLASQLGLEKLAWSDRNAKLPSAERLVTWQEAVEIVEKAFMSFSPTLSGLFKKMIAAGWIDAPHYEGKQGGAFNMSTVLPEPLGARTYTLLNFLGKKEDVTTLAHESGHAVNGLLAGEAQGALMSEPPIVYAETASIFAEMVAFQFVKEQCATPEEKLALLMNKINSFMNSVVRQIGFSMFEQRVHEARKDGKLTSEEFTQHFVETTAALYGKDGEVFTYKDTEHLWSFVTHFLTPFYVYGYAFGELLTQSLYAVKDQYGDRFEPLYLDLLRAGSTKDAVQLLAPFGLDPRDPEFWKKGMEASVGKWLDEAEQLAAQIAAKPTPPTQPLP